MIYNFKSLLYYILTHTQKLKFLYYNMIFNKLHFEKLGMVRYL